MYMTLRNRAQKLDPEMIGAQRLKRLPSIVKKLELFKNMQLSQMQDLGGCRAVVGHIEQVDHLVKTYKSNPPPTAKPAKIDDYVTKPKEDGYRSVHLVYKYQRRASSSVSLTGAKTGFQMPIQSLLQSHELFRDIDLEGRQKRGFGKRGKNV